MKSLGFSAYLLASLSCALLGTSASAGNISKDSKITSLLLADNSGMPEPQPGCGQPGHDGQPGKDGVSTNGGKGGKGGAAGRGGAAGGCTK